MSSYKHGLRSPTLATAARILAAAGFELTATPTITATVHLTAHGRDVLVPSRLPRLDPSRASARVTLPLHVNWSDPRRSFDLRDRRQRARVYEIVLRKAPLPTCSPTSMEYCSSSSGRTWYCRAPSARLEHR